MGNAADCNACGNRGKTWTCRYCGRFDNSRSADAEYDKLMRQMELNDKASAERRERDARVQ